MTGATHTVEKRVQELSSDHTEPPPRFIVKDECNHSSLPFAHIPTIDLRLLSGGSQDELIKLRTALSYWGCFQAIGHEISDNFLENVRATIRDFFALPVEEKNTYIGEVGVLEGYGNDYVFSDKQVLDWSDRLLVKLQPENQRKLKLWPGNPGTFRDVIHKYSLEMDAMFHLLLKAISRSVNLQEDSFLNMFGDKPIMLARFNFFPVCLKPNEVMGTKAHTDGSGITIVMPDKEVQGLELFKDGKWFRVPIIPDAFVVNLGDQLELMSNGIFKSPLHRVAVNSKQDRISTAVFYTPEDRVEINVIEELIDQNRPRKYRNVKDFAAITFKCYQNGKAPLDTVRI